MTGLYYIVAEHLVSDFILLKSLKALFHDYKTITILYPGHIVC